MSTPLEIIYNHSLSSGLVPDQFKLANVIPIHKKDSTTCINNYSPISLLSIINKIMKKLMYKRLINFIDKYGILYDKQFGFHEQYSTTHATRAIEDGKYSCVVFLDFSKTFDTVDHSILITKLSNYGIRGIAKQWFTSYLTNKRQFVSVGSARSEGPWSSSGVTLRPITIFTVC